MSYIPYLTDVTLNAVKAESMRAHYKHRSKSLLSPEITETERLAAIVEELGEVAELFTYDKRLMAGDSWKDMLVRELIQLGNVALSSAQALDHSHFEATHLDDPAPPNRGITKNPKHINPVPHDPASLPERWDFDTGASTHASRILDQSDEV